MDQIDNHLELEKLIQHLHIRPDQPAVWKDWQIKPIFNGMNNQVFRVTKGEFDLAVKFCIRDSRRRAQREYQALRTLSKLKSGIAPNPVMVDYLCKPNPVIVMEWLRGEPMPGPPQTKEEWKILINHYVKIHSIRPPDVKNSIRRGVVDSRYAKECVDLVLMQVNRIPEEFQSPALKELVGDLKQRKYPRWSVVKPCLCRVDPNPRNFINKNDPPLSGEENINDIASVDWENSGWGDAAFDFSGLITHVEYLDVPQEQWNWVIQQYCHKMGDNDLELRIRTYWLILLIWWVARLERYLYEIPRGLDPRLVSMSEGSLESLHKKLLIYQNLSLNLFDT